MTKGDAVKVVVPILVVAAAIGVAAYLNGPAPNPQACTEEAMLCPDGSAVGRTGPNCAFAPCPEPVILDLECSGPGDRCASGYTCIERCGPPVAREDDPPPGYYCAPDAIAAQPRNCPICLASDAMIATPWGDVGVRALEVGDVVWSVDADGKKMAYPLVAVTRTPVASSHEVVRLELADGREVRVSPNHPTADGRLVGELRSGEPFDGSVVLSAEREPYGDDATYDLLPDSETGYYWANGVLLDSTLSH